MRVHDRYLLLDKDWTERMPSKSNDNPCSVSHHLSVAKLL